MPTRRLRQAVSPTAIRQAIGMETMSRYTVRSVSSLTASTSPAVAEGTSSTSSTTTRNRPASAGLAMGGKGWLACPVTVSARGRKVQAGKGGAATRVEPGELDRCTVLA